MWDGSFLLVLLLGLLGSLVLGLLGGLLVLVHHLLLSSALGDLGLLPFLDLSDGLLSQGLLVFVLGCLELLDGIQGNTFDGTLLFEDSLLLLLSGIALLDFLMKSPPGGCPSKPLSLELPEAEVSVPLGEEEEGPAVLGDKPDTLAGVDLPLAEVAELGLDHHRFIKNQILKIQYFHPTAGIGIQLQAYRPAPLRAPRLLPSTHNPLQLIHRFQILRSNNLDEELRVQQGDIRLGDVDWSARLLYHSLGGDPFSLLVGFSLPPVVLLHALQELLPAGGEPDVLDSHMDALGDDSVSDLLVDDHTDGSGVDVEDGAGAAVVVLVGHSLVDGPIDDDVDDVAHLVGGEGPGDVDGAVLLEPLSELMSGSAPLSVAVSHLLSLINFNIIQSFLYKKLSLSPPAPLPSSTPFSSPSPTSISLNFSHQLASFSQKLIQEKLTIILLIFAQKQCAIFLKLLLDGRNINVKQNQSIKAQRYTEVPHGLSSADSGQA